MGLSSQKFFITVQIGFALNKKENKMAFTLPPKQFNVTEWTRNKLIRSNQTKEAILRSFITGYEDFWGVSGADQSQVVKDEDGKPILDADDKEQTETVFVSNGCRHTLEEMQACVDLMGAIVIQVLTESAGFIAFASQAYPTEFPERYRASAFDYKIDGGRLVLTSIKPVWAKKE